VVAASAVDSLVLASDSTTTQGGPPGPLGPSVYNTWNSANKVFNLRKTWPIGAMTWGQAAVGGRSIATLAKELRCRFSGERPDHSDWELDPEKYTIAEVADRVKDFFCDELYMKDPAAKEVLGLAVGGFSAGADSAELLVIQMDKTRCVGPDAPFAPGKQGLIWFGQTEAITRLVNGVSSKLGEALEQLDVPKDDVPDYTQKIMGKTGLPLVFPGMPVGETIELAEFLVETTIKFVRFAPGPPTVGGPVEIAAMTRYEGFKWIKRKHHYPQSLNPGGRWP